MTPKIHRLEGEVRTALPLSLSAACSSTHFRKSGQEAGSPLPMMQLPGSRRRQLCGPGELGPIILPQMPEIKKTARLDLLLCLLTPAGSLGPMHTGAQASPTTRPVNQGTSHYTVSSLWPGFWSCHFLHLLTYASGTDFFTFAGCMQGRGQLPRSRASGQRTHKTRRKFLAIQVILQTW